MTNSIPEMPIKRSGSKGGGGDLCEGIFQEPENECLESRKKDTSSKQEYLEIFHTEVKRRTMRERETAWRLSRRKVRP